MSADGARPNAMKPRSHGACTQGTGVSWRARSPGRTRGAWKAPTSGGGAAEAGQGLGQDGLAVGVAAALLHVGQMRLVGLNARRRRGLLLVLAGRVAAPGALPGLGYRGVGSET